MKFLVLFSLLLAAAVASSVTFGSSAAAASGSVAVMPQPTPEPDTTKALFSEYRGVTIGMSAADARAKLGEASQRSASGDYYVVSPTESVQVLYDRESNVRSITINFSGNLKAAPSTKDVLGEDIKKESDGSIYKLVRYPASGFWVSYNRTAGNDAVIVVTMQKMPKQ